MAQGGGKRDGEDDDSLPEVEAELVDETASGPGAFDADAAPASPEQDVAADDAPADTTADASESEEESASAGRKSTLTPGVMLFLAFSVVAIAAFGVWRLQSSPPAPDGREAAQTAPPQVAVPASANPAPDTADRDGSAQENDETAIAEDKIANIHNGAKPSATLSDPRSTDRDPDGSFLPPVTQAGAAKLTNSVEAGAKEALRRFQEGEADPAPTDPSTAAEDPAETTVSGFELESAQGDELNEDAGAEATDAAARADNLAIAETVPGSENAEIAADASAPPNSGDPDAGAAEDAAPQETAMENDDAQLASADAEMGSTADLAAMRENFEAENARLEAELGVLRQRNTAQQSEIEGLRAELASAITARDDTVRAANAQLSSLRADMEKIRNERATTSSRQMNAAFALTALSHAIDQGTPYGQELAVVIEFDPSAAALGAHAQTGIETQAALRQRFGAAARAAHAAAGQANAENWVSGLAARAKSLVNVRPANPVPGDSAGAVLSRAEHALEAGDVGSAVEELEALPPSAKAAMSDWIGDARVRAEIEASLAMLQSRLVGETG